MGQRDDQQRDWDAMATRIADGRWTVDRTRSQSGSGATPRGVWDAAQPKDEKGPQAHLDICRELKQASKQTPQGEERLDHRNDVINVALVKDLE